MDSSKDSSDVSPMIRDLQTSPLSLLAKAIKQSKIVFIGTYLERRYVYSLQAYRDIIAVDNDERKLFQFLGEIQKTAQQQYGTNKWIGITCDMKDSVIQNYNLWVELEGIPLGRHWFQLKSMKVRGQSVQLYLKYMRVAKESNERRSLGVNEYPAIDYRELLTYENACGTLKFLTVFVMSLLTVACNAVRYLGDYSVRILHELSGVIRALTPILFGIIDFFSKCVGGMYWLLYMLFRGDSVPPYQIRPPIDSYKRRSKNYDRRAICYE